ncbi:hypothetical protein C8J57DRAFT_1245727 [Mycena rebaudengoi]|nr:hypothetical protein C8J57DRAFT_1245727 [Mycena rebaudengoi]
MCSGMQPPADNHHDFRVCIAATSYKKQTASGGISAMTSDTIPPPRICCTTERTNVALGGTTHKILLWTEHLELVGHSSPPPEATIADFFICLRERPNKYMPRPRLLVLNNGLDTRTHFPFDQQASRQDSQGRTYIGFSTDWSSHILSLLETIIVAREPLQNSHPTNINDRRTFELYTPCQPLVSTYRVRIVKEERTQSGPEAAQAHCVHATGAPLVIWDF